MALIKLLNIKVLTIVLAAAALLMLMPSILGLVATILKFALAIVTKFVGGLSLLFGSIFQILTLIINGFGNLIFFLWDKIFLMISSIFGLIGSFFGFLNTVIGYVIQHFIFRYTNVGIFPPIVMDILKSILGCFDFGKKFFKQLEKLSNSFTKNLRFNFRGLTKNFKRKLR